MPAVIKDVIFDNRMVSVVLITYNQERHIRKAIESVLSQETAFDYEIIIGEDCSVDKTRAICKEYQQKYPSKIHLFLHESNIGMHQNFLRTVCRANGKYIALCEGDDFWTNPQKLQMQYDLLEKNPDFSGVHTKVCYVDAHDIITGESDLMPKDSSSVSFDYLVQKNVIHTCSFMFRKSVLDETVDSILNAAPIPDYTLFLAAALKGGIYYFNTITAAYRKNAGVSATWTFSNLIKDRLKIYSLFEKYYDLTKHRAALCATRQFQYVQLFSAPQKGWANFLRCRYLFLLIGYTVLSAVLKPCMRVHPIGVGDVVKLIIQSRFRLKNWRHYLHAESKQHK